MDIKKASQSIQTWNNELFKPRLREEFSKPAQVKRGFTNLVIPVEPDPWRLVVFVVPGAARGSV
jgi:hypothetical protein